MGLGDGGNRVVTLAWRVHDHYAVKVGLVGPATGLALEHDGHRWLQPSCAHRRPHLLGKRRAAPGRSRHQPFGREPMTLAASMTSISPDLGTSPRAGINTWGESPYDAPSIAGSIAFTVTP